MDGAAVPAAELLTDASKLPHSLLPIVELLARAGILVVLLVVLSIKDVLDDRTPSLKQLEERCDHFGDFRSFGVSRKKALHVVLVRFFVFRKLDVSLDRTESLAQFKGELVEDG